MYICVYMYVFVRTANPQAKNLEFHGFGSVSHLHGRIPRSTGDAPRNLTRTMLACEPPVCTMVAGAPVKLPNWSKRDS